MKKFFYYLFKFLTFPFCFIGFVVLSLVFGLFGFVCSILEKLSDVMESNFEFLLNLFNKIFKFDKE